MHKLFAEFVIRLMNENMSTNSMLNSNFFLLDNKNKNTNNWIRGG